MEHQISPAAWNGVFAFPNSVVDKHIKLAGAAQLKTLLWIFRHNGEQFEAADIAAALGMNETDVKDSMQYWIETGLLCKCGEAPAIPAQPAAQPAPAPAQASSEKPVILPPPAEKPTFQDVVRRAAESEEVKYLLLQAQLKLGKTISPAEQSALLWMHDWLGLPVEVILMIIGYAVMDGKSGMAYIEKVGIDWSSNEIDTIEKAEAKIKEIQQSKQAWGKICGALGIPARKPSKRELNYAHNWIELWQIQPEAIAVAYDECVNHTGKLNLSYINKILERWNANGIKTAAQAEAFDSRPAKPKKGKESEASYDIDEFERMSMNAPIVYKKEG